jgi:hypothetical protein
MARPARSVPFSSADAGCHKGVNARLNRIVGFGSGRVTGVHARPERVNDFETAQC